MATFTLQPMAMNVSLALLIPLCMYFRMQSANAGRGKREVRGRQAILTLTPILSQVKKKTLSPFSGWVVSTAVLNFAEAELGVWWCGGVACSDRKIFIGGVVYTVATAAG